MSGQNRLKKYFRIAKIFLTLTPLLCLIYMTGLGGRQGMAVTEVIRTSPIMAVTFLTAMLNPFAAYLLDFAEKRMEGGDYGYAAANLLGLIAIQAILMNLIYAVMLMFLFRHVKRAGKLTFGSLFQRYRIKGFLYEISGSLVMLPVAALCLFAQIRLMVR